MAEGLSDELAALHARRSAAEREIREALFGWAMEHGSDQTLSAIRSLANALCDIASRAVVDAYNLPRP